MDLFHAIIAALSAVFFLLGTPQNVLAFSYFARNTHHRLANKMYAMISCVDAVLCFLMLQVFVLVASGYKLTATSLPCVLFSWSWNILSRFSIFTYCILTVSRVVSLYWPFRRLSQRVIVGVLGTEILYLVLFECSAEFRKEKIYVYDGYGVCDWTVKSVIGANYVAYTYQLFYSSMYNLPMLVTITSSVMALCIIRRNKTRFSELGGGEIYRRKQEAAKTVLVMVVVYVICNVPYSILVIAVDDLKVYTGTSIKYYFSEELFQLIRPCYSVALNATLNPLVYYARIRDYRRYVENYCYKVYILVLACL